MGQQLPFEVKDARKVPVEYLWFVGDYASFDPRAQAVTLATARVFYAAGLDFGILFEAEQNAGTDVRRVGEEGLFEMQRDKNLAALAKAQFRKIVTTDPHSYHALHREYGTLGGDGGVPVLHHTEVLAGAPGERGAARHQASRRQSHLPRPLLSGPLRPGVRPSARASSPHWEPGSRRCRGTGSEPSAAGPAAGGSGWKTPRE